MNVRDILPRDSGVLALLVGCPWLIYNVACALLSVDPTLPDRPWTDGT